MHLYRYGRGEEVAITRDPDGRNLPESAGPWTFINAMTVHGDDVEVIGAATPDIIKAIEDRGFYILYEKSAAGG